MKTNQDDKTIITSMDMESLKKRIENIYKENKLIHVSVNNGRSKIMMAPSFILGIYNHFISVKSKVKNYEETFTIGLIDIKCGKIVIDELLED